MSRHRTIISAAEQGDIEALVQLIREGSDLNGTNRRGYSPLRGAVANEHCDAATILLAAGADVNGLSARGWPPIYIAVRNNDLAMIDLLISHGADVTISTAAEDTPLHVAAERGFVDAARRLIDCNADCNARERNGYTPLHLAVQQRRTQVVSVLLASKADFDTRDGYGYTPLRWAAELGYADVAKQLLEAGANPDLSNSVHASPIHLWDHNRNEENLELLRAYGQTVVQKGLGGCTPLYAAVEMGHDEIVQLILKNGADPNIANEEGDTPLRRAVRLTRGKMVKWLKAYRATVVARDRVRTENFQRADVPSHPEDVSRWLRAVFATT